VLEGCVETRLHGALGNAKHLRDFGNGELAPEAQGDESLFVWGQPSERSSEVALGGRPNGPDSGSWVEGDDARPSGSPPELVTADIDQNPGEPAICALTVAQGSASIPGEQGCLLDRILGGERIVEDEGRESAGTIEPSVEQPADSIVPRYGCCGLVEHALPSGRGLGLSP
jgi:hypothetical protein